MNTVCMEEADNTNVLDRSFLYKGGEKGLYVCVYAKVNSKRLVLSRGANKCMRGGGWLFQDTARLGKRGVGDGSNLFINGGG